MFLIILSQWRSMHYRHRQQTQVSELRCRCNIGWVTKFCQTLIAQKNLTYLFPYFFSCICPVGTFGSNCKILSRKFYEDSETSDNEKSGGSWAWLPPLPSCTMLHISLYIMTKSQDGILLYVGSKKTTSYKPYISLQLMNGRPKLMVRTASTGTTTIITLNSTVADNKWHRIDVGWFKKVSSITHFFYLKSPTNHLKK